MNEFPVVLRTIRAELGLSQKDFAGQIGMKPVAYNMVESGKNKPTFELLLKIVEKFKVEPKIFFSNNDLENNKSPNNNLKENGLLNDISPKDLNSALLKIAQAALLHLEFHLLDIDLNLKLLNEKLYKKKFNKKEYDNNIQKVKNVVNILKSAIASGSASNSALINFILTNDELTRTILDKIRDISKELYLND